MGVWVREIQLRASVRIGELSRELDTAPSGPRAREVMSQQGDITPKREALADAGLSKSAANRYEHLAGGRDVQAQRAGKAAMEHYFAKSRAEREPPTMAGLRSAVKDAVVATVGPPPARPQVAPPPPAPTVAGSKQGTKLRNWSCSVCRSNAELLLLHTQCDGPVDQPDRRALC